MGLPALLLACVFCAADDDPSPVVEKPPAASEFLVIPLRVHVLTAGDLPELDCKLTDDDVRRIVGKVNKVWRPAGIHWGLETIVREPAARLDRFKTGREEGGRKPASLGLFRVLMPKESRAEEGLNVYYIHKFSVNGVYLGDRVAFVQETAKLREVEGGIDEPIPRVTAHELGHSLGLPHRQARTNLLASGTTGTTLNADEVAKAREKAKKTPGTLTADELRKRAEAEPDAGRAVVLKRWLDEISAG